jgi:hypothetical protein
MKHAKWRKEPAASREAHGTICANATNPSASTHRNRYFDMAAFTPVVVSPFRRLEVCGYDSRLSLLTCNEG